MPHIELRVSPNLSSRVDGQELPRQLVGRLSEFETVSSAAIKGYQTAISEYCMGAGASDGFIHVTARVLSGRSLELRRQMADALHAIVKVEADRLGVGASVEIREMDKDTYIK